MRSRLRSIASLAILPVLALSAQPAFAITGVISLSDTAASIYGTPGYQYCDPSGTPEDGIIHYDSSTATAYCGIGGPLPGFSVSFKVEYGTGAPTGISGITGALYHIKFTDFTLVNMSTQNLGPGDTGFTFTAISPGSFPDGVVKRIGIILAGSVDDNDATGGASMSLIGTGGIDTGGAATSLSLTPTSLLGSALFDEDLLGATTFGIYGGSLTATLYLNGLAGNGLTLPSSFDVVVLGDGYSWAPVAVVPAPAAVWLLGSGVAALGALRRYRPSASATVA